MPACSWSCIVCPINSGFHRRPGEGPTLYPVACAPQSWAAASVFLLLQACLGLSVRGYPPQISFSYPLLPPFLQESPSKTSMSEKPQLTSLSAYVDDVSVNIRRRQGKVEILTVK